mgnify:CR=1 FL=1
MCSWRATNVKIRSLNIKQKKRILEQGFLNGFDVYRALEAGINNILPYQDKLDEINGLNFSTDKSLQTKRLDWKFWLGKNNKPEMTPNKIEK